MFYSAEFRLPQFPGRIFRMRSIVADWRLDVPHRMAVLEVVRDADQRWVDFMTIREPDEVATIEAVSHPNTKR